MEITEFIAARLAEDEHVARMAADDGSASANWHVDAVYPTSGMAGVSGENGEVVVRDEGSTAQMEAEHIARHDPARVLREVAAKRAILARYEDCLARMEDPDYPQAVARDQAREYEDFILPNLAAVHSDHPDYRAEWKP